MLIEAFLQSDGCVLSQDSMDDQVVSLKMIVSNCIEALDAIEEQRQAIHRSYIAWSIKANLYFFIRRIGRKQSSTASIAKNRLNDAIRPASAQQKLALVLL